MLGRFLASESAGGLLLMGVAAAAIVLANSPFAETYFALLKIQIGPLSLQHWINDALMAVFFLLVGLEIKREILIGQLSDRRQRLLPLLGAVGGMIVPAAVYTVFNSADAQAMRGWAIPMATDIAFALGVMVLLGPRVPVSLKVFLTALAIIDDLGAVLVIALFYTEQLSVPSFLGAAVVLTVLALLNRRGVASLWPYLTLGSVLWLLTLLSGIHATVAGVALAMTIPLKGGRGASFALAPLQKLESALHLPVAFAIIPIFGFANAGVALGGAGAALFAAPLAFGVAAGLVIGKFVGVLGAVILAVGLRLAPMPADANWGQVAGVALLCGIGFTMSLFIGLLAFNDPALQEQAKIGILMGSAVAGIVGYLTLRVAGRGKER